MFQRYAIVDDADVRDALRITTEHVKSLPTERKVVSIGKK
jgi:hypothetical protein